MTNAIALINLMGAFEGILLSAHFFSRRNVHRFPTLLVGLLLLSFSFPLLNTFLVLSEVVVPMDLVQRISNLFLWVIGPCFFLYIRFYTKELPNPKATWIHFLPFFLHLLLFPFLASDQISGVLMVVGLSQMGTYMTMSLIHIKRHRASYPVFLKWLQPIFFTFLVVFVINLAIKLLSLVLWVPELVSLNVTIFLMMPILLIAFKEMRQGRHQSLFHKKYQNSEVEVDKARNYLQQIVRAMEEEHLYRQPELTVKKLAEQLGIPVKAVSQLINDHFQQGFTEFINHYRIEDVKEQLIRSENRALKILAIARQSGFNSGGRFNTLFRQHTGMTPSEYKRQHSQ